MSFLVVALLSLLWLGFFLPSVLQARRTSSPYTSATTFQDSLRRLGEVPYPRPPQGQGHPTAPGRRRAVRRRRPAAPRRRPSRPAAVAARRRAILAVLAAAVVAGAVLAVSVRGWMLWAAGPPAVALTGYVVMLRRDARRRAARGRLARAARSERAHAAAAAARPEPAHPALDGADIVPSVGRRSAMQPPERMAG